MYVPNCLMRGRGTRSTCAPTLKLRRAVRRGQRHDADADVVRADALSIARSALAPEPGILSSTAGTRRKCTAAPSPPKPASSGGSGFKSTVVSFGFAPHPTKTLRPFSRATLPIFFARSRSSVRFRGNGAIFNQAKLAPNAVADPHGPWHCPAPIRSQMREKAVGPQTQPNALGAFSGGIASDHPLVASDKCMGPGPSLLAGKRVASDSKISS